MPAKLVKRNADPTAALAWQIEMGLNLKPVREYRFDPIRRWKFDLALPRYSVAIEIEGGLFTVGGGRHNRGAGMRNDLEKYNAAILATPSWRVLRILPEWVANGKALGLVERAVNFR